MSILEAAIRGGAAALLLLLSAVIVRDARHLPAACYGVLLALGGAGYAVVSAPDPWLGHVAWVWPLQLISLAAPAAFWLWAGAHFDDDFVPSRSKHAVYVALLLLGAVAIAADRYWLWRVHDAVVLVLVGIGAVQVVAGLSADLVEGRRRWRIVLPAGIALYILTTTLFEIVANGSVTRLPGSLINAIGIAVLAFAFAMMRLRAAGLTDAVAVPGPTVRRGDIAAEPALDPPGRAALAALRRLMDEDRIYREPGLNIAAVAARLGIAEYRLRRLINQHLGHRNFSSFVNGFRLAEAKAALADPAQEAVPVLTIALDAGFQSIGPFNRAFKSDTGMTPTEYRRAHAGRSENRAAE